MRIPELRSGSFFPTLMAPRRRIDVALHTVIMEAYLHGIQAVAAEELNRRLADAQGAARRAEEKTLLRAQAAERPRAAMAEQHAAQEAHRLSLAHKVRVNESITTTQAHDLLTLCVRCRQPLDKLLAQHGRADTCSADRLPLD